MTVLRCELPPSPCQKLRGFRVELVEGMVGGAIFVVIAFDARRLHCAHKVETRLGVGAIADQIAQESVMGTLLTPGVFQNRLEGLKVCMNICQYRELHLDNERQTRNCLRVNKVCPQLVVWLLAG